MLLALNNWALDIPFIWSYDCQPEEILNPRLFKECPMNTDLSVRMYRYDGRAKSSVTNRLT